MAIVTDELALNYHLMHPGDDSAPGDPNPAFFLDGTYHLHYILRHPWHGAPARPLSRRGVVLVHPRHQPGSAALDVADHEAAALLHRPRDVQRHGVHHQGGEAGGHLLRRVRAGQHVHRGRGRQRSELVAENPTPSCRAASPPARTCGCSATRTCSRSATPTTSTRPVTTWSCASPRTWSTGPTWARSCSASCRTSPWARTPPAPTCSRSATGGCWLWHQPPARLPVLPRRLGRRCPAVRAGAGTGA